MRRRALLAAAGTAMAGGRTAVGAGCGGDSAPPAEPGLDARTIAQGLDVPWGLTFLPGGDALVGERDTGRILRVPEGGGSPTEVMRIPDAVLRDTAEGGLLGLAVSPDYSSDGLVYAYHTTRTDNRIVRFRLGGAVQPLLTGLRRGTFHNGGRIAFGPDGKLYAGVGEAGDRPLAQERSSLNGKILRLNPDGSVPADNPFHTPVWTYGHRNVQGMGWDSAGRMWATEFGQDTWDEINLIEPEHNYGWPDVEGIGDTAGGRYTNPLVTWKPAEASPSGAAILQDTMYVAALRGERLWPVRLSGTTATAGTAMLRGVYGRIRTAAVGPDGRLWLTTSNRDGRGHPKSGDDQIISIKV